MSAPLDRATIQSKLSDLPGWAVEGNAIQKTFTFPSFMPAIAFVQKIAEMAEKADHHPDILIRYKRVTFSLSTHSAGGITEKDFALAQEIEKAFSQS